jgi:hypothetical protein
MEDDSFIPEIYWNLFQDVDITVVSRAMQLCKEIFVALSNPTFWFLRNRNLSHPPKDGWFNYEMNLCRNRLNRTNPIYFHTCFFEMPKAEKICSVKKYPNGTTTMISHINNSFWISSFKQIPKIDPNFGGVVRGESFLENIYMGPNTNMSLGRTSFEPFTSLCKENSLEFWQRFERDNDIVFSSDHEDAGHWITFKKFPLLFLEWTTGKLVKIEPVREIKHVLRFWLTKKQFCCINADESRSEHKFVIFDMEIKRVIDTSFLDNWKQVNCRFMDGRVHQWIYVSDGGRHCIKIYYDQQISFNNHYRPTRSNLPSSEICGCDITFEIENVNHAKNVLIYNTCGRVTSLVNYWYHEGERAINFVGFDYCIIDVDDKVKMLLETYL